MRRGDRPEDLTRRALLARAVLGAGGIALSWPSLSDARRVVSRVRLRELGGQVWATSIRIRGSAAGAVRVVAEREALRVARDGERFEATVPIERGRNRVIASARGEDAVATYRGMLIDRPSARPVARVEGTRLVLDAGASLPSAAGDRLQRHRWRSRPVGDELPGLPAEGEMVEVELPPTGSPLYLSLEVSDRAGRSDVAGLCLVVTEAGVRTLPAGEPAPWIADSVVYGVVPFAFGYAGFADVEEALDRISATGANTLWLSPTFATERFEFGYGIVDYFATRRDYGGEEDLRRLIDAAHAHGMRVLLDIAVNHSSREHPYFTHARRLGRRSHQFAYYDRDSHGRPTHYFDWNHLPNLNYDNAEVRTWITAALVHWVRELDIDGYRFDAAWGVRRRRPGFWPDAITAIRRVKPDAMLLAEASAEYPYYRDAGFDLAYDWTRRLGRPSWEHAFDRRDQIVSRLDRAIGAAPDSRTLRFMNNNDTGERFVARHGVGLTRAAAALLMTLPGVPAIYTGDESGARFDPYETYGPIRWGDHPDLRRWYRALGRARKEIAGLRTPEFRRLTTEPAKSAMAYARGSGCIVVINFSPKRVSASIDGVGGRFVDALSGRRVEPSRPFDIGAFGAMILVARGSTSEPA